MFRKKRRMDDERLSDPKPVPPPVKQDRKSPNSTNELFRDAQKKAALLLQRRRKGILKKNDYLQAVSELAVRDHDGREWIPVGNGTDWYYYDGAVYHKGIPPTLQAESGRVTPTVTSASSVIQPGRRLPTPSSKVHSQENQQPCRQQQVPREADTSRWQAELKKRTDALITSQQEIAELKTTLRTLTEEVQKLRQENQWLDQQFSQSQGLGAETPNLREKIEQLEAIVSRYQEEQVEWQKAQKEIQQYDARIQRLEAQNTALIRESETLRKSNTAEQNKSLLTQLQQMEIQAKVQAQRLSELESEKLRLEQEAKKSADRIRELEARPLANPGPQIQSLEDVFKAIGKS